MNIRKILREELYKKYNIDNAIRKSLYENINKLILNETLSSKLYHFRGLNGLLNILETNQFKLSTAGGRDYDLNKGYKYFISFTRSKKTTYTDISTRNFVSRFWIDGDKLNQKYKSVPVNYYNDENYKDVEYTSNLGLYNESEDRLLSNKPTIDNFLQYVTRIDINIGEFNFLDKLKSVCDEECMKHIYVYVNTDDFYLGNNKCYNLYENYDKLVNIKIEHNYAEDKLIDSDDFEYDGKIKGIPNMVSVINDDDEMNIYNIKEKRLISDIWFDEVDDFYHGASAVLKNRNFNFIFPNGKLVSKKWFDYVDNFEEDGYAKVKLNNKFNLLKLNGEIKFNNWYDDIIYHNYNNNLCIIKNNGKYNVINNKGDVLINNCDKIKIKNNTIVLLKDDKIIFIDKYGNIIDGKNFNIIGEFNDGLAKVEANGKYNFINYKEKLISSQWFDESDDFNNGFAKVSLNGKWNFINTEGELLSKEWFDYVVGFNDGLSDVKLDGKWNFINTKGTLLYKQWFDDVIHVNNDNIIQVTIDDKMNIINRDGTFLSKQWFDYIDIFYNGFAIVELDEKYNFIGTKGNLLSERWFDGADNFEEDGYAKVETDGKEYKIDRYGKLHDIE